MNLKTLFEEYLQTEGVKEISGKELLAMKDNLHHSSSYCDVVKGLLPGTDVYCRVVVYTTRFIIYPLRYASGSKIDQNSMDVIVEFLESGQIYEKDVAPIEVRYE